MTSTNSHTERLRELHPGLSRSLMTHELEGIGASALRRHYVKLSSGLWLHRSASNDLGTLAAAYSRLYPGSVVCGWAAASLHGFTVSSATRPELCIGRTLKSRKDVHFRRHALPPEAVASIRGVPVTTVDWTVYDLARLLSFDDAVLAVESLARDGYQLDRLARTIDQRTGTWGAGRARRALASADPRSESPPETITRLRLHEAGLTAFEPQVWIPDLRYRLDLADRWAKVGIEYHGRHHALPSEMTKDMIRRNRLEAEGWIIVVVTYEILRDRPDEFITQVRAALERVRRKAG